MDWHLVLVLDIYSVHVLQAAAAVAGDSNVAWDTVALFCSCASNALDQLVYSSVCLHILTMRMSLIICMDLL